jgi:hypothetical protein
MNQDDALIVQSISKSSKIFESNIIDNLIESGTGFDYHDFRLTTSPAVKHTRMNQTEYRLAVLTKSDRNQTLNKASYYYNT